MKVTKEAKIANFNVVVGEEEEPMLNYFDTLIYPAFTSGIKRIDKDAEYSFKGVNIVKNTDGVYWLVGKIVKKTTLEIRSDLDEKGDLIEVDELYSAAPYSTFVINLKNHRMALVPNQKGSPLLASFRKTVFYILNEYRKKINNDHKYSEEDKNCSFRTIPQIDIAVVGIPSAVSIKEALRDIKKINELTLRFYPLNGDIDFGGLFGEMITELRRTVGSNRGEMVLRSPKNIEGVEEVLEESGGTVEPIIKVTTNGNGTMRVTNISENHNIDIEKTNDYDRETNSIVKGTAEIKSLNYTNENHDEIYEKNKPRIKKCI